jgi:hypothetical protein
MDKHERPYKCLEPECDKIEGFTYSGGLLRHQREVHEKETGRRPLMCPHADCHRSSGHGFSRLENLKEHLRRKHMPTDGNEESLDLVVEQTKRETEDEEDLRKQIQELKRQGAEKDRRLQELEMIARQRQRR